MKKLFLLFLIPFLWVSCPSENNKSTEDAVGLRLDRTDLTLVIGKKEKLTATVTGAIGTNRAVTWSSSDENTATVKGGTVTAVAPGEAVITVTSWADFNKTAACTVTVTKRPVTVLGNKKVVSEKTAAEYFKDNHVFIGWNLGNAFDSNGGYGNWTRKIDKDFLPKVKAAGFSMVRIPVTWNVSSRPIGPAPDYKINATTMSELVQVVDWAYDSDLVTIINIHHDDNPNLSGWMSMAKLLVDADRPQLYAKFEKLWEQIAAQFKDYGEWLIFEPFNEIHDGNWGNGVSDEKQFEIINELNKRFTDKVRASGGNNAQRFLVVQPLCAKPHQAMADTFIIPKDTATGKQIVSMHFYEPEAFALGNDSPMWGSQSDKYAISSKFASFAEKFTKKGIPLIFGESGASYQNRSNAADRATAAANRIAYMEFMCTEAKKNGIIPIYWDNGTTSASSVGENFGLWDRRTSGTLDLLPGMQIVIDTMVTAVQ